VKTRKKENFCTAVAVANAQKGKVRKSGFHTVLITVQFSAHRFSTPATTYEKIKIIVLKKFF
jgi:hypothetical protein